MARVREIEQIAWHRPNRCSSQQGASLTIDGEPERNVAPHPMKRTWRPASTSMRARAPEYEALEREVNVSVRIDAG